VAQVAGQVLLDRAVKQVVSALTEVQVVHLLFQDRLLHMLEGVAVLVQMLEVLVVLVVVGQVRLTAMAQQERQILVVVVEGHMDQPTAAQAALVS
jgi:hypothetical protein